MQIDSTIVFSQFLGSLPTFIAVILAWMHNNARIADTNARFDKRFDDLKDVMRAEFATVRAEMRRVEEVWTHA